MLNSKAPIAIVACGLAAVLLALPSESQGGLFDWMYPSPWDSPAVSTTTYMAPQYMAPQYVAPQYVAPQYVAPQTVPRISLMPAVTSVSAMRVPVPQTCYYAPQTRYRWTYSRMPVTTYRPVTALDPCSGCARTVYQPVTTKTLLPWLHQEPYTAYRLTCSPACAPGYTTASYSGCPTSCPTYCDPCGVLGTVSGSSCPAGCAPITAPTSTFKTEEAADTSSEATQKPELRLKPIPDLNGNPASTNKPKASSPEDLTAARPIRYATYRHPITRMPPASPRTGAPLDVSGWRAARD